MQVPFYGHVRQYNEMKAEIDANIQTVILSGQYVMGPMLKQFEQELAAFHGTKYAIGVGNGTDAIWLALMALGVGPGDEVITTPFTYIAPAESVHQVGAKLVFADVHPRTFNLDPADVARRITPRTRAIIPVHLFGQAAPLRELLALAGKHGIQIVEDCAQAIGATYQGCPVGGLGRLGCFSFYPTKNLGADGDGGMVVTNDEALAKKLRMLRVHGIERRYRHDLHGYNSRLDELQAAIVRVKLPHLRSWNARRVEIARRYSQAFRDLPLEVPLVAEGNVHVFHVYAVLTNRRDALQQHLTDHGVPTIIYYPLPLHLQRVYAPMGWKQGDFPVAEALARRILPLPMYPELTDEQVDYVIETVKGFRF